MKLEKAEIHTESSTLLGSSSFGIGNLALVFDILRNKLYKDPVYSLCREYLCNARDAHREAGKHKIPIEVHFPGFETSFKIKDYGPGISPERMETIFTQYGSSTKQESNDQTGAFGLGGKSAFAYSDSFQIIAITDGKQRTYTAYIDETQVGKMALNSEKDTSEPNGTTIVIPIKKNDNSAFQQAVYALTQFWDVKPKFFNSSRNLYKEYDTIFTGTGWKYIKDIHSTGSYYGARDEYATIVADGIPYKFSEFNLIESGQARSVASMNVLVEVNTGEISFAASRDSIHYDKKTISFLNEKFKQIHAEFQGCCTKQVSDSSTYAEAIKKAIQIPSKFKVAGHLKWRGNNVYIDEKSNVFGTHAKITEYSFNYYKTRIQARGQESSDWDTVRFDTLVAPNSKIFKNNDDKLHRPTVLDYFNKNKDIKTVYIISKLDKPSDDKKKKSPYFDGEFNTELVDLLEAEDFEPIKIEKIKKDRVTKKVEDNSKIIVHPIDAIRTTKIVDNKNFIYTKLNMESYDLVMDKNSAVSYRTVQDLATMFKTEIFALPPSKLSKVDASCKSLDQYFSDFLINFKKKYKMTLSEFMVSLNPDFNVFGGNQKYQVLNKIKDKFSKDSLFIKFYEESAEYIKINSEISYIRGYDYVLKQLFKVEMAEDFKNNNANYMNNFNTLQGQVKKKYPMLLFAATSGYAFENQQLIDYVNLVDKGSL